MLSNSSSILNFSFYSWNKFWKNNVFISFNVSYFIFFRTSYYFICFSYPSWYKDFITFSLKDLWDFCIYNSTWYTKQFVISPLRYSSNYYYRANCILFIFWIDCKKMVDFNYSSTYIFKSSSNFLMLICSILQHFSL